MNALRMMILAAALGLLALPALADVEIPEEWIGIWELNTSVYDCETNALIFASTVLDTICPGSVFEDPDPGEITAECTGSADADSYTTHCEGSQVIPPDCTVDFVFDVSGTRTGDSYSSVGTMTISYTGESCLLIPDTCNRTEITGTRIATDPGPCEITPVENQPWATVKSYYR